MSLTEKARERIASRGIYAGDPNGELDFKIQQDAIAALDVVEAAEDHDHAFMPGVEKPCALCDALAKFKEVSDGD